jgi:hypothetical protein
MEDHRLDEVRVLRAASGRMLNPNFYFIPLKKVL